MKKFRAERIAVLLVAAVLFSFAVSFSAAADYPLQITRDLAPVCEAAPGETVTLSVEAVGGNGSISYQWFSNALAANAVSSSVYSFTAANELDVYCVISSGGQFIESTHCHVTVRQNTPRVPVSVPVITVQPKAEDLSYGQAGILSVQAVCANLGNGLELEYQWYSCPVQDYRYATPISGATSSNYIIPASYAPGKMYYLCSVRSTNGTDHSGEVFSKLVSVYCGELNITKHPTGESVKAGGKATFIARADGAAAFQWRIVRNDGSGFYRADEAPFYISGLQVYGADSDTLVLSNIPESMNGMSIICVFYADAARTQFKISNSALLTVKPSPTPVPTATPYTPPKVTVKPAAKTILAPSISVRPELMVSEDGQSISLSISATDNNISGTALKYQWYRNSKNSNSGGTAISGARAADYTPASTAERRYYYVGVWATDGNTTSKVVYSDPVLVENEPVRNAVLLAPSISVRPELTLDEDGQSAVLAILAVDNNDDTELQFQWYKSSRNSNTGGTAVSGARSDSYVPVVLNASRYYYVGVWATDGESESKIAYSEPVLVSKSAVLNLGGALLAPSVSVRPELIASEEGNDVSLSVRAVDNNDDTELQFQWYKSKTNSVSGGKIIPGAENSQYVPILSSDYKYYYVAVWATDGIRTSKVAYSGPVLVDG